MTPLRPPVAAVSPPPVASPPPPPHIIFCFLLSKFQHFPLAACCLALLLFAACAASPKPATPRPGAGAAAAAGTFEKAGLDPSLPAEWLKPPKDPYRLGPGDKVEIEILEVAGTRQECRVMPDGLLYYHTAPAQKADGLTLPELKTRLETSLKDFYRHPQVSIILRGANSRRVWVLGRVNTPGLYPLDAPMTVVEAISRAGGLFSSRFSGTTEELADLRHSFLVRKGAFVPVDFHALLRSGDTSQNIYLEDGDYIYLPSALSQEVYVMGAVQQPKAVGFMDQVTLVSAVSDAKGPLPGAWLERAVIVRGSLTEPTVAVVNLGAILAGKEPDVALQPRDIVWIPNSPWSGVAAYTRLILNAFTRTVAANEGGRAAVPDSSPIRSNLNLAPSAP